MRTDLPVWRLPRMKRMRDSLIVRGLNLRTRMAAPGGAAACAIGRRAAAAALPRGGGENVRAPRRAVGLERLLNTLQEDAANGFR